MNPLSSYSLTSARGSLSALTGPALIGVAAMLWATDAIFRLPALQTLDPVSIVLVEHLICLVPLLLWTFGKWRRGTLKLKWYDWVLSFLIGAGGSALATLFFTASFRYVNPSVTILLQKLQPVLVVLFAHLFLKERPKNGFLGWAVAAFLSAFVLSFPDLDFSFLFGGFDLRSRGTLYALGAASLWALSTVAGKVVLRRTGPDVMTFWRYAFGTLALGALLKLGDGADGFVKTASLVSSSTPLLGALVYMALIPGLVAMLSYYRGLSKTPASVATFVELLYPVSAVVINTFVLGTPLNPIQIGAAIALLFSVTRLSL